MKRRSLLAAAPVLPAAALLAGCGAASAVKEAAGSSAAGALTVKDAAGRTVTLPKEPQRIALGESRQAYALPILQDRAHLLDRVVGWADDMKSAAPDVWKRLLEAQPKGKDIPIIGSLTKGDLSVETLIGLEPDLFCMTLDQYEIAKSQGFVTKLEKAKIPFVVTDYRRKPVKNTHTSVTLLGAVFGQAARAKEFLAHYDSLVQPVVEAAKKLDKAKRPTAFVWRSAGVSEPGRTFGDANLGQILRASGGVNIGTDLLPGDEGTLTTEQLIASQPRHVIATGGEWSKQKPHAKSHTSYVHLGYDADETSARDTLRALVKEPGYAQLDAFRDGRVHGIYHQFYDAPFNFVVYRAFAEWMEVPGLTGPSAKQAWEQFHERFMPWKASGVVAVSVHA